MFSERFTPTSQRKLSLQSRTTHSSVSRIFDTQIFSLNIFVRFTIFLLTSTSTTSYIIPKTTVISTII